MCHGHPSRGWGKISKIDFCHIVLFSLYELYMVHSNALAGVVEPPIEAVLLRLSLPALEVCEEKMNFLEKSPKS